MSTSNFIIFFFLFIFIFAFGFTSLLEYSSTYKVSPIEVTIVKNCCDTGYCIKSLDNKIITKISTNDGVTLLKTKNVFFSVKEIDVFGYLVKEEIEWKRK